MKETMETLREDFVETMKAAAINLKILSYTTPEGTFKPNCKNGEWFCETDSQGSGIMVKDPIYKPQSASVSLEILI